MPTPMVQANGKPMVMPVNLPASRRTGLNFEVDTRWVNGYGYRPVEVTITSPQPTTAAHSIMVELHAGWDSTVAVQQQFEMPAGATRASTTISVPFYDQSVFGVWWDVWVDGVKDNDLSLDQISAARSVSGSNVSGSTLRVLILGPEATQKMLVTTPSSDFEVLSLTPNTFPQRWIDYSCLDVVSLSVAELEQLNKTNPAALEAIRRWVRTGGYLWICDVGTDLEKLPDVSKLLQVSAAMVQPLPDLVAKESSDKAAGKNEAPEEKPTVQPVEIGWRPGRFRGGMQGQAQGFSDLRTGQSRWVNDQRVIAELERDSRFRRMNEGQSPDDLNTERRWPTDSSQWYVEQRYGLGALRAFRGPNEVAQFARSSPMAALNAAAAGNVDAGQLPRSLNMALRTTRQWVNRHGLVPDTSNLDFAKLLVPGVGLAPVTEFQVLITLFVVLIGPFNYWILKRYKRLQMLVLTVPVSAGLATAALFAYAIVSDGFDTKIRVRSLATIDQTTGEAACWARTSYYAGMAPSAGLTMTDDTTVYPILAAWSGEDTRMQRSMIWNPNAELLTRGWLVSRTPTQYLMVRSRKTPNRLDVTTGNGKMQIVNRLGVPIESLLVLDEESKFFTGQQLAEDARVALKPISRDDAVKQVVALIRDNEPELPAALAGGDQDFFGRRGRTSRRSFTRSRPVPGDGQLSENLANRAMADLAGLNGRPALELPPRSYVAVTTRGAEVETGIPYAEEEASFHVVVGRW